MTSGVPLPQSIPSTSQWQLIDWTFPRISSGAAAGGLATITFDQLDSNTMWALTHMVSSCTSPATTSLRLYTGSVAVPCLIDGTDAGNFNVAEWNPGLVIPSGGQLIAQWSGCTDGAIATITAQAQVLRRSS